MYFNENMHNISFSLEKFRSPPNMNPSISVTTRLPCAHLSREKSIRSCSAGGLSRSVVFSATGQHFFVDSRSYHLAESPPLSVHELFGVDIWSFMCYEMGACIFTIGTFRTFLYLSVTNNIQVLRTIPFMGTST